MKAACTGLISVPRCLTIPVTATNSTPVAIIQRIPCRLLVMCEGGRWRTSVQGRASLGPAGVADGEEGLKDQE